MAPTKDELEQENAELRDRVAELEAAQDAGSTATAASRPVPRRPDYLSAGEAADLAQNGVTVSPFTGETLTASREGIEPLSPEAKKRDQDETRRLERLEGDGPLADRTPVRDELGRIGSGDGDVTTDPRD
jgi:hypothetical protein